MGGSTALLATRWELLKILSSYSDGFVSPSVDNLLRIPNRSQFCLWGVGDLQTKLFFSKISILVDKVAKNVISLLTGWSSLVLSGDFCFFAIF